MPYGNFLICCFINLASGDLMHTLALTSFMFVLTSFAASQAQLQLNLMPLPASVLQGSGILPVTQSFSVSVTGAHDPALEAGVRRFVAQLSGQTGIPFRPKAGAAATLTVRADKALDAVQKLGEDESYQLTVTDSGAQITAPTTLGALHGLQTFLQMVVITPSGFAAPAVTIKDQPRFPWRGTLIDVSRHFIPIEVLKRNLDGMAAVKMNVLHWHLSDDQGFRVESKTFPKLAAMGSEGHYYTQAEIRDFISYAHDLGIRVIPEFDTPGHSRSWFVGYPELASGAGPFTVENENGASSVTDPTREETYKFMDKFVEEMGKLFPDAYFHIGGDEVDGKFWDSNPKIQAFKQAHGMKTNQDLQAYYNQRLQKILAKHHKTMIGWDEILHPDLPKTITVQSWRGQDSLAAAAKQGYSGLLSYGYYLDLMWPAARHYAIEPMSGGAASLTPEQQKLVLGGESCMWAEFITDDNVDSRIWPRAAAISERLWSESQVQDVNSMYFRLNATSRYLELLGLRHRSNVRLMLSRMAGTDNIAALLTLADVAEPASLQVREEAAEKAGGIQTSDTPLNRIVDAVLPESEVARRFTQMVDQFVRSKFQDAKAKSDIRALLLVWRDNDSELRPLLQRSYLLKELSPVSQTLSSLGSSGLQALNYIDKGEPASDSWQKEQIAMFQQSEGSGTDLFLAVAPAV